MADNVQVAIKVRPLIPREKAENLSVLWQVDSDTIFPIENPEQKYSFDHIFNSEVPTSDVFNKVALPIVDAAVNGINGTLFAYGQTSSGKTYTMMGTKEEQGVITLAVFHIFKSIENTAGREFLLRVSYLELYNEKLRDLLSNDGQDLKIRDDMNGGVYVKCKEEVTNSPAQVLDIMHKGNKNRKIGETNMNERSSRSHTIFRIIIESRVVDQTSGDQAIQVSHLNLVDLAGSERATQTKATGDRLKEGGHINKSLLALSLVIKNLTESADNNKFVNYRGSKLTRLLQTSLGGNAMTGIICAVTPAALEETHSTLYFASTAKNIKNKPQVNEVVSDGTLLKRMAVQLARLNQDLEKAKSNESSSNKRNMDLMERIKRLEETILLSGSSAHNTQTTSDNRKKANRRRTWCGKDDVGKSPLRSLVPIRHKSIQDFSPIKSLKNEPSGEDDTPFEEFELDLLKAEEEHCKRIPEEDLDKSSIPVRYPARRSVNKFSRLSTLSEISEGDSRMSMDSVFNCIGDEVPPDDLVSPMRPATKYVCCPPEKISSDKLMSPSCDTPCRLRRQLSVVQEELEELGNFTRLENNIYLDELKQAELKITELNQDIEKLQNEKGEMEQYESKYNELQDRIGSIETENYSLKENLKSMTKSFENLESKYNDLVYQTEYKDNKYVLREKELLFLLEQADNSESLKNIEANYKSKIEKHEKDKEEMEYTAKIEKQDSEKRLFDLSELVETQKSKILELEDIIKNNNSRFEEIKIKLIEEKEMLSNENKENLNRIVFLQHEVADVKSEFEIKCSVVDELNLKILNLENSAEENEKLWKNSENELISKIQNFEKMELELNSKIENLEKISEQKEKSWKDTENELISKIKNFEKMELELNSKIENLEQISEQKEKSWKDAENELVLKIQNLEEKEISWSGFEKELNSKIEKLEQISEQNEKSWKDAENELVLKIKNLEDKEKSWVEAENEFNSKILNLENALKDLETELSDKLKKSEEANDEYVRKVQNLEENEKSWKILELEFISKIDCLENALKDAEINLDNKLQESEEILKQKEKSWKYMENELIGKIQKMENAETDYVNNIQKSEATNVDLVSKIQELEQMLDQNQKSSCNDENELIFKIENLKEEMKNNQSEWENTKFDLNNRIAELSDEIKQKSQKILDLEKELEDVRSEGKSKSEVVIELESRIQELEQDLKQKVCIWENTESKLLEKIKNLEENAFMTAETEFSSRIGKSEEKFIEKEKLLHCENEYISKIQNLEQEIMEKNKYFENTENNEFVTKIQELEKILSENENSWKTRESELLSKIQELEIQIRDKQKEISKQGECKQQIIMDLENQILANTKNDKDSAFNEELQMKVNMLQLVMKNEQELLEKAKMEEIQILENQIEAKDLIILDLKEQILDLKKSNDAKIIRSDSNELSISNDITCPIADLESLVNLAKTKYEEIVLLLDNLHKAEANSYNLQNKVEEIQSLNAKCQKRCEKLREELLQKSSVTIDLKNHFDSEISGFEQNIKSANENLNNLTGDLHSGDSNLIKSSEKNLIEENMYLKEKLEMYKNMLLTCQNDLQEFKKLLYDLASLLQPGRRSIISRRIYESTPRICESKFEQSFDNTIAESTFDSKFLLADNSLNESSWENTMNSTLHPDQQVVSPFNNSKNLEIQTLTPNKTFIPSPIQTPSPNKSLNQTDREVQLDSINWGLKTELRKLKQKYNELNKMADEMKLKNCELEKNLNEMNLKYSCLQNLKKNVNEVEDVSQNSIIDNTIIENKRQILENTSSEIQKDFDSNSHISKMNDSLRIINVDISQLEQEKKDLENEIQNYVSQIGGFKSTINELNVTIEDLNTQNSNLHSEIEMMKTQKSNLESDFEEVSERCKNLEAEFEEFKVQNSNLTTDLEELKEQNANLVSEVEKWSTQNSNSVSELEELRSKNSNLEIELGGLRSGNPDMLKELEEQRSKNSGLVIELEELRSKNSNLFSELEEVKSSNSDSALKELEELRSKNSLKEIEELKSKNSNLVIELEELRSNNPDVLNELDELRSKNSNLLCELEELRSNNPDVLKELEELRSKNSDLFTELEKLRSSNSDMLNELEELRSKNSEKLNSDNTDKLKELEELRSKNSNLVIELEELRSKNSNTFTELEELKSSHSDALNELEELRSKNSNLSTELDELRSKNSNLNIELEGLGTGNPDMLKELEELRAKNSGLLTELEELRSIDPDMLKALEELTSKNSNLVIKLDELRSNNSNMLKELEELRSGNVEMLKELEELRSKNSNLVIEIEELRSGNPDMWEELEELRSKKSDLFTELEELRSKNSDTSNSENTDMLKELEELRSKNSNLFSELEDLRSKNSNLVTELEELRSGNPDMLKECEELRSKNSNLVIELEELKSKNINLATDLEELRIKHSNLTFEFEEFKSIKLANIAELMGQNVELKDSLNDYISLNDSLSEELTKYRQANPGVPNITRSADGDIQILRDQNLELQTKISTLQADYEDNIDDLQLNIAELETSLERSNTIISNLTKEINELKAGQDMDKQHVALMNSLDLQLENSELKERIEKLVQDNQILNDLKIQNTGLEGTISILKSKNEDLKEQLVVLKQKCVDFELQKSMENENLGQIDELKIEIELQKLDLDKKCIAISEINEKNTELKNIIDKIKSELETQIDLVSKLNSENEKYKIDLEKLNLELQSVKDKNIEMENDVDVIKNDYELIISGLNDEISVINNKNIDLERDIVDIKKEYEQIQLSHDETNEKLLKSKLENTDLLNEIQSQNIDITSLQKENHDLERYINEINEMSNKLQENYDRIILEKLEIEQNLKDATLGFNEKTIKELSVENEIMDLENQLQEMNRKLKDKDQEIEQYSFDKSELLIKFENIVSNYDTMKEEMKHYINPEKYDCLVMENSKLNNDLERALKDNEQNLKIINEREKELNDVREERLKLLELVDELKNESLDLKDKLEKYSADLEICQKSNKQDLNKLAMDNSNIYHKANSLNMDLNKSLQSPTNMKTSMFLEISGVKNEMQNEIKALNMDDIDIVKNMSLHELFNLFRRRIMKKQVEICKEMQFELSKSKSWNKDLEKEINSLNEEIENLNKSKKEMENVLENTKDLLKNSKEENDHLKTQIEQQNLEKLKLTENSMADFKLKIKESEIAKLKEQNSKFVEINLDLKNKISMQKLDNDDFVTKYTELRKQFGELKIRYEKILSECEVLKKSKDEREPCKKCVENQNILEQNKNKYEFDITTKANEIIVLKEQLTKVENNYSEVLKQLSNQEQNLIKFEDKKIIEDLEMNITLLKSNALSLNKALLDISNLIEGNIHDTNLSLINNYLPDEDLRKIINSVKKLTNEILELKNKNTAMDVNIADLKNSENELKAKISKFETNEISLKQEIDKLNVQLEENRVLLEKHSDNEDTEKKIKKYKDAIKKINGEKQELIIKLKSMISTNNELQSKCSQLDDTAIKSKESENMQLRNVLREKSKNLDMIGTELKSLKREYEDFKNLLENSSTKIRKAITVETFKARFMHKDVKPDVFESDLNLLIDLLDQNREKAKTCDKIMNECDKLETENTSLLKKLEQVENNLRQKIGNKSMNSPNEKLVKDYESLKMKLKYCMCSSKDDTTKRLQKELEGATNYASEAKKKMAEQNELLHAKEREGEILKTNLEKLKEECYKLHKDYGVKVKELNEQKESNNYLSEKIKKLEAHKTDHSEIKLRRRSLHDSSRNLLDPETADKSTSVNFDPKLTELQQTVAGLECTIVKLNLDSRSREHEYQNQIGEFRKRVESLQCQLTDKKKELRRINHLIQENTFASNDLAARKSTHDNSVQTDPIVTKDLDGELKLYKEKYIQYKKLCIMRADENKTLRSQLNPK